MPSDLSVKIGQYWIYFTFSNQQIRIQAYQNQTETMTQNINQQSTRCCSHHIGTIDDEFVKSICSQTRQYTKSTLLFFDYLELLIQMNEKQNYEIFNRKTYVKPSKSSDQIHFFMICEINSQVQYFPHSCSKVVLKVKNLDNFQIIDNLKFQQGEKRYQNYYTIDLKTVQTPQLKILKKIVNLESTSYNKSKFQFLTFRLDVQQKIKSLQQKNEEQNAKMQQTLNNFLIQTFQKVQGQLKQHRILHSQPLSNSKKKKNNKKQRVPQEVPLATIQGQLQEKQKQNQERNKDKQLISHYEQLNNENDKKYDEEIMMNHNQDFKVKGQVKHEADYQQQATQERNQKQIYDSDDEQIFIKQEAVDIYQNYNKIPIEFDQQTTAFHHFKISNKKVIKLGGFDYVPMLLKYRIPEKGKHFISMKLIKIRKAACLWFGIVQQKVKKLLHSSNYKNFLVYKINTSHVVTKVDQKQEKVKQRCDKMTNGQHIAMQIDMDNSIVHWYLSNGGKGSGNIPAKMRQMTLNPFVGIFNILSFYHFIYQNLLAFLYFISLLQFIIYYFLYQLNIFYFVFIISKIIF